MYSYYPFDCPTIIIASTSWQVVNSKHRTRKSEPNHPSTQMHRYYRWPRLRGLTSYALLRAEFRELTTKTALSRTTLIVSPLWPLKHVILGAESKCRLSMSCPFDRWVVASDLWIAAGGHGRRTLAQRLELGALWHTNVTTFLLPDHHDRAPTASHNIPSSSILLPLSILVLCNLTFPR